MRNTTKAAELGARVRRRKRRDCGNVRLFVFKRLERLRRTGLGGAERQEAGSAPAGRAKKKKKNPNLADPALPQLSGSLLLEPLQEPTNE